MTKPITNTTTPAREGWIFFSLLAAALYVVYYRDFTRMGLYEDDWSAIAPYANGTWSVAWSQVKFWMTHWPNGRPLGLSTCAIAGWGLYHLGGMPALYLLPYTIVLACAWTVYRISREALGPLPAFLGAVTCALLPTDTLRLSLHGAPHLYLAALCMLLAIRALQRRSEWAAAPLTLLGLLFHESSTLTIFLGPLLFLSLRLESIGRTLRYWSYAALGLFAVFLLRVFVFAEARATSTFSNLPQVIARSLTSLKTGTITHWGLVAQRCQEAFRIPVAGSAFALGFLLLMFAAVIVWQRKSARLLGDGNSAGTTTPLKAMLFGVLAFSVPYLVYFTDPYWPCNHVAGRIASVHSASGIGFAFCVAGLAGLIQTVPRMALRMTLTTLLAVPLAALLAWGNVVRSQYLESWQNQQVFWHQMLDRMGEIKSGTLIFNLRENYWTPPFTWVIGSNSWADSIVLRHIYQFPPEWSRDPRVFAITGPWKNTIKEQDGHLIWPMPPGDWLPADVMIEPGNLMIFNTTDGLPVPQEGEIEIAGRQLKLMNPSHGQRPQFPTKPLFNDLLGK